MTHSEFLVWYAGKKAGLDARKAVVSPVRRDIVGALEGLRRKFGSVR